MTGLDASVSFLSTSPDRLLVSPMYNLLQLVQVYTRKVISGLN